MQKIIVTLITALIVVLPLLGEGEALSHRRCIILLDQRDANENVGQAWRFYLMSKLEAAVAEQCSPILVNMSLWNSFVERRNAFRQALEDKNSKHYSTLSTYNRINERIAYWNGLLKEESDDVINNKDLLVQRINQEFYDESIPIADEEYQMLLCYSIRFDPEEWYVYKNDGAFLLLIPKKYCETESGFKISSLETVENPEDIGSFYFESHEGINKSIVQNLSDFFLPSSAFPDGAMPYAWDIVLSGHGGGMYDEFTNGEKIEFRGEPFIADLPLEEFYSLLDFFDTQVKTNLLYYATCFGGGTHTILPFQNQAPRTYTYALMCGALTDCWSYCKYKGLLPSDYKKFLTTADLKYDAQKKTWQLPLEPPYKWNIFFETIGAIDFKQEHFENNLPEILWNITDERLEDISLLRLPGATQFYPMYPKSYSKISDLMLALSTHEEIRFHETQVILLESEVIAPEIHIENSWQKNVRIISITPGNASHYFNQISSTIFLDLPSVFWQTRGSNFNKTFLINELRFPNDANSRIFKNIHTDDDVVLKNVLITASKDQIIRIFFTINDSAMMVVAHNPDATIQEIVTLTPQARLKYEERYAGLIKDKFPNDTLLRLGELINSLS